MAKEQKERYGKTLYKMEKPKAINYLLIEEDIDDDWFIYVRKIDKKTKLEKDRSMIIRKDLEDHLIGWKSLGWIISDNL